jgi:glucosamine--fructose-6-phosphate aminotransferase (isomerizing)
MPSACCSANRARREDGAKETRMLIPGLHTRQEIDSQPAAWAATLAELRGQGDALAELYATGGYDSLLFTGCGSTYYLAVAAAALAQELCGIPARGVPASELWLDVATTARVGRRPLLIAISRSGETTETLRACEAFQGAGGDVLTLSCYPGRPLVSVGKLNLVLPAGQEQSIAQTRAFSTLYVAAAFAIARWSGRDDLLATLEALPAAGRRVLDGTRELARAIGGDSGIDRFYVLGSGLRHGLACEISLKLKEMSLSHSEPFHFLEFRHGPKSMVTPGTLVIGLLSDAHGTHERAVLDDMRAQGGRVLAIAERDADVALASGIPEAARAVLYLPAGQQIAFERAVAQGLDPDRPLHLDAVVRLDSRADAP